MRRSDVCWLIEEHPAPHGVGESVPVTEREVFCQVRSCSMRESYEALAHGLHPELVITLTDIEEYNGEHTLRYRDVVWTIIRTYMVNDGGLELTVERRDG